MEEWRDIEGYEGLYQVSNLGRVRSLKFGKERVFGNSANNRGYIMCALRKNKVRKTHEVHVLVAEAFIPNPNNYTVVHHKNHNPKDNRVENLEWMDRGEHQSMHNVERCSKRVDQIDSKTGDVLHQWNSTNEAARELGYDQSAISKCCQGKLYKTHKGYIWKYVEY